MDSSLFSEVRSRLGRDRRLAALTMAGLAAVAGCAMVIAKLTDDVLGGDDTAAIDPRLTDWVVRHRTEWLTTIMHAVTHLGDAAVVAAITVLAAVGLLVAGKHRLALFMAVAPTGAAVATLTAKRVVDRPRPPARLWLATTSGPAFPSGHATQAVACWGALAVAVIVLARCPVWRVAAAAIGAGMAVLVGVSRVYLAVHWTSDVICGWSVATLWLATLLLLGWARPRLVHVLGDSQRARLPDP